MMKKLLIGAAMTAFAASSADAAWVYVGSWQVDQGPNWSVVPPAYTGQDAAALLFGGSAGDYAISTIDSSAANIDFQSWVSVWFATSFPDCAGFPCGRKVAQGSVTSTGGLYQNPGDESAFVYDWAVGPEFTNYAFVWRDGAIPEPATWGLMIAGFGLVGATMRRRRDLSVSA
jgi:hypothetical protein